jgi:hypothetical protein
MAAIQECELTAKQSVNISTSSPQRRILTRLSIVAGNVIQIAGLGTACVFLVMAESLARSTRSEAVAMIVAWILSYFCCHGIAHWSVGRLLGIRFAFYTVGGTGNPTGYPFWLRWLFEHLPFFGVQTEKVSMLEAAPMSKAIMWSAGVTSSAVFPTLSAFFAWRAGVPGSTLFLIFAVLWALGALSSNWRSQTGDYAKARRALHS